MVVMSPCVDRSYIPLFLTNMMAVGAKGGEVRYEIDARCVPVDESRKRTEERSAGY